MADPLLSSLCRICHINTPKYTCPRCSLQTCSLPCSRRHKLWKECNGVRDPTVYKPLSQVATPSGIDHDYNFLHSIEHKIERSEKEIITDRGLLDRRELQAARSGTVYHERRRRKMDKGEECIRDRLMSLRTRVDTMPKGMKRNSENHTTWSKNRKCMNIQVEWIFAGVRSLGKVLDKNPLGSSYETFLEEERRKRLSDEEKKAEKKRKAVEVHERDAKKFKMDEAEQLDRIAMPLLQDPKTSAWCYESKTSENIQKVPDLSATEPYVFYLHRPYTPSVFPKIVIPLNASQPFFKSLENQILLEFPTIFVFKNEPDFELPEEFMLESEYYTITGQKPPGYAAPKKDSNEAEQDSDTSSEEDDDVEMEEGEIV